MLARLAFALALAAGGASALYLPGVAPLDFAKDDVVYFKARSRRS